MRAGHLRARPSSCSPSPPCIPHQCGGCSPAETEVAGVELQVLSDGELAVEGVLRLHHADAAPNPRRRTLAASSVTSRPPTYACPEVGTTRVVNMPMVVDFLAPFGPSNPKNSSGCTSRSTPQTAATVPRRFGRSCAGRRSESAHLLSPRGRPTPSDRRFPGEPAAREATTTSGLGAEAGERGSSPDGSRTGRCLGRDMAPLHVVVWHRRWLRGSEGHGRSGAAKLFRVGVHRVQAGDGRPMVTHRTALVAPPSEPDRVDRPERRLDRGEEMALGAAHRGVESLEHAHASRRVSKTAAATRAVAA